MSANSKIQWTEATWNPVRGCSRISEGCRNCYAERQAARFSGNGEPFATFAELTPSGPRWTGKVELIPEMLDIPLRRKKPTTYFVNSMSDLFHEALSDDAIDRVFAVMALCPQHTFQVLTKRAARMREYFAELQWHRIMDLCWKVADKHTPMPRQGAWPLPNVWLGVSVEDQPNADARIPHLLATPAALRFVSYEPALGPVDFTRPICQLVMPGEGEPVGVVPKINWLIVGGESGPHARPFDVAWARSAVAQCQAAGVPCFVKQLGARSFSGESLHLKIHKRTCDGRLYLKLADRKGGDPEEWPSDLRVREMPQTPRRLP